MRSTMGLRPDVLAVLQAGNLALVRLTPDRSEHVVDGHHES